MPFKKLHPTIQEKLENLEITSPTAIQKKGIPVIKSGANVYCTAPKDGGKTTTLILTTLQKLKFEPVGTAPRTIVLVENKEKALEMYDAFVKYTRYTDLRVYVGYEQLHIDTQRSEIFEGVDVLISTPITLNKLFLLNGVNTSQLKMLSIDDAAFLSQKKSYTALMSISQSIEKCQFVLYSEKIDPTLKKFESYFMQYAKKVSI
ncbi:DEAD/DEAH box helicase [Tenacibaculum aquimarinum]|uniref:DEAD/DEAH box helicase n=1 Tax=Tenacibaculum aquimarinum TaxID=2910675 RepID=UPI001F0B1685|nr:DEAD/DEAH box helicase [Tenacibaculum aquimarinum]MCH3885171.1 DEAD/DEAH box helicase [Tenacibaculum aquimarinum]